MSRTGSPRRALLGGVLVATVAAVAGAAVLAGPPAVAQVPGDAPVRSVAVARPIGVAPLAAAARTRVSEAAQALALAATPEPPRHVYCPAPGSEFVDSWGFSRSGGRHHKGVDMMAPHGTPVIAPFDGVIRSSNSALGGLGFSLVDAAGNEYFGTHLATLDVTGLVAAGTRIGTVGSSGNADSPHLHFEVSPGGAGAVDPFPYALSWCTQDPADPWADVLIP